MGENAQRNPVRFASRLLAWSADLDRPLPWRAEADPYRIWLSEMLLQQTRAAQAAPYYLRFVERFPRVQDLAAAPESEVLKLWEGLGYYSRALNLHRAARLVAASPEGRFPETLEGLLQLPGVGPYTAAAIASFAFGKAHAVVDGNVIRVLTRVLGYTERADTPAARAFLQNRADQLMGKASPAAFNQAIMDFGAEQCTPRRPDCASCPFARDCQAHLRGLTALLPIKKPKAALRDRYFLFLVLHQGPQSWLVSRDDRDVWRRMHTFPLLELDQAPTGDARQLMGQLRKHFGLEGRFRRPVLRGPFRQILSHQRIHAHFLELAWEGRAAMPADWIAVDQGNFPNFALPRIMHRYLSDALSYLGKEFPKL